VHLKGSFLLTRAVQEHVVHAKRGRIVNLSSTSALGSRRQRRAGEVEEIANAVSFFVNELLRLRIRPGDLRCGRTRVLTAEPDVRYLRYTPSRLSRGT